MVEAEDFLRGLDRAGRFDDVLGVEHLQPLRLERPRGPRAQALDRQASVAAAVARHQGRHLRRPGLGPLVAAITGPHGGQRDQVAGYLVDGLQLLSGEAAGLRVEEHGRPFGGEKEVGSGDMSLVDGAVAQAGRVAQGMGRQQQAGGNVVTAQGLAQAGLPVAAQLRHVDHGLGVGQDRGRRLLGRLLERQAAVALGLEDRALAMCRRITRRDRSL